MSTASSDLDSWIERNAEQSVAITQLQVKGGQNFRDSFLEAQWPGAFEPGTLKSIINRLERTSRKFNALGVPNSFRLDLASNQQKDAPLGLNAVLTFQDVSPAYISLTGITREDAAAGVLSAGHNNLFGGSETFALQATRSTQSRQADSVFAEVSSPLFSNVAKRIIVSGFASSSAAPWASHSLLNQGITAKFSQSCGYSHLNQAISEVGLEFSNRSVSGLGAAASDAVRAAAGTTAKYSAFFNWSASKLDDPLFTRNGSELNVHGEIAGLPALDSVFPKSDVSFVKAGIDGLYAKTTSDDRLTVNFAGSFGILSSLSGPTSIVDRYFLGGFKDIYGFQYNGLGPKADGDAVGGDAFASGKISIYTKLPLLVNSASPLRFLMFFNGASLVGAGGAGFVDTVKAPFKQTASTATGVGLCYKTKAAQLELTYSVPLHVNGSDSVRGGLQFGVGLELS